MPRARRHNSVLPGDYRRVPRARVGGRSPVERGRHGDASPCQIKRLSGGGPFTSGGGQFTSGGGQFTNGGGQFTNGGGQFTSRGGQFTSGGGQFCLGLSHGRVYLQPRHQPHGDGHVGVVGPVRQRVVVHPRGRVPRREPPCHARRRADHVRVRLHLRKYRISYTVYRIPPPHRAQCPGQQRLETAGLASPGGAGEALLSLLLSPYKAALDLRRAQSPEGERGARLEEENARSYFKSLVIVSEGTVRSSGQVPPRAQARARGRPRNLGLIRV
eukprot:1181381-Prorocentrum_minimum.AAC.2